MHHLRCRPIRAYTALMAQERLHNAAKVSFAGRSLGVRATAFWLVTCFLLSLGGYGQLAPAPVAGQSAFANRDTSAATIPRQSGQSRLSASTTRHAFKTSLTGGAFGLPDGDAIAILASGKNPLLWQRSVSVGLAAEANLPRGPPALA